VKGTTIEVLEVRIGSREEKGGWREYNRQGELVQSTVYLSMELSQWNLPVLLMYANKNNF
jgi:hypothetical protein